MSLRDQRELRGWTQERLAEEIDRVCRQDSRQRRGLVDRKMISKWERGKHPPSRYYQEALCTIFAMTAQQLGFVRPSFVIESPVGEYMDLKRRQLLHLLGIAGTALVLPLDLDIERIIDAAAHPGHQNAALIESLDTINQNQWRVYRAAAQKSAVLEAVLGQLGTLISFLKDAPSPSLRKQLCILTSDIGQLAGEIFFDVNDHASARSCYNLAAFTAKEARQFDLWACSLVRQSFLSIYADTPGYQDAIPLLQGAERLAERGDPGMATRYWVAAVLAEALSGVQNLAECQQALDLAEGVKGISNGGWLRFDGERLLELRGACYVRLHQPDLAFPILQQALSTASGPRRRGMILVDLAKASIHRSDVDGSCTYASEAMLAGPSGFVRKNILGLRSQLAPYSGSAAVKRLDQQLVLH